MGLRFFRPRLVDALAGYSRSDFLSDLIAGVTVGVVALPLAIAFAIASGVRPEAGLITAIVAGFLISLLGGSRFQIGGPTAAFVAIVYAVVSTYGLNNLLVCTIMAGLVLVIMGLTGMGSIIKYIPFPVTTGFTTGIAVLILSTQIKDFFGLSIENVPAGFIDRMRVLIRHSDTVHWPALLLAIASVALIAAWPKRLARRIPGSIVAMALATLVVYLADLPVETIGSRFGGIPRSLPWFRMPDFDWSTLQNLIRPALTIALLGAMESLLSAVVADGMTGERHDSNQELVAQGIANIVSPLVGGFTATGAIARTATNIRAGARSPVAGIIHAFVLLAILLVASPLARFVPLATLSAVLIVVGVRMGEWGEFKRARKLPKSDGAVLFTVFALTVLTDLTVAVEVGMVLAGALFVRRVVENTIVSRVDASTETEGEQHSVIGKDIPDGVVVYRVFGAFLFGTTEKLEEAMHAVGEEPRVLILRLRKIIAIDSTGLQALERLHERLRSRGQALVLSGTQAQPLRVMERSGFLSRLGKANLCPNIDVALERARTITQELARRESRAVSENL